MVKNVFIVELSRGLNGTYVKSNADQGKYWLNDFITFSSKSGSQIKLRQLRFLQTKSQLFLRIIVGNRFVG